MTEYRPFRVHMMLQYCYLLRECTAGISQGKIIGEIDKRGTQWRVYHGCHIAGIKYIAGDEWKGALVLFDQLMLKPLNLICTLGTWKSIGSTAW